MEILGGLMKDIFAAHQAEYDSSPACVASAPAVVTLLGEHTGDTDGIVLAAAISFEMKVAISPRKDSSMRFFALDLNERKRASTANLKYKREDRWANNIKSVYDYFSKKYGFEGKGINVTISGNIPAGLSLGISAAVNMAATLALKNVFEFDLKPEEFPAEVCKAQSVFWEKPVPLYDYLACAVSGPNSLSVIDLASGKRRGVPFLGEEWEFVLTDSKVPRVNIENELRQRYEDCRKCLQYLSPQGKRSLREVKPSEMDDLMGILPESIRRRCIHVVEELGRISEAEDALAKHDAQAFGKIINKSHLSLRNHFEISCPEVDWLVKRSLEIDGVLCSRITGPGFGGCVVSIMKVPAVAEYRKRLEEYERIFGFRAQLYETSINGGLHTVQ